MLNSELLLNRPLLLTPGPVSVLPSVHKSLLNGSCYHHRTSEFSVLLKKIEALIRHLFNVEQNYHIALMGTSGTGAVQALFQTVRKANKNKILLLVNGHFGERLKFLADELGCDYQVFSYQAHTPVDLNALQSIIQKDERIGVLLMVHHETSLGQCNPLPPIASFCSQHQLLFGVDMVSSVGGEDFNWLACQPDIAVTVSGKALGAFPGIAIAMVKKEVADRLVAKQKNDHYFDLIKYIDWWENRNSLPFTPPIPLFLPLLTALQEIEKEGLAKKLIRHQECLSLLKQYFYKVHGFAFVPTCHPSNTTMTFCYTHQQARDFIALQQRLFQQGFLIYQNPHYHKEQQQFQVSTMGAIHPDHLAPLLKLN